MKRSCHSSDVILTLFIRGSELSLSHVGSDFRIIRESEFEIEGGEAELLISVDGVEEREAVIISDIPSGRSVRVAYVCGETNE